MAARLSLSRRSRPHHGSHAVRDHGLTIRIDAFDTTLVIEVSDSRRTSVALGPDRAVADIWHDFRAALADLAIDVDPWDKPQETIDTTPFAENTVDHTFDDQHAQRFHRVLCAIDGAFETFRSPFFGRSGVQFWWGGVDFSVGLFTARHLPAPDDRGYVMRHDLDIVPRPDGCERASMQPSHMAWAESMGEWVLPWDRVHANADPRATILAFLKSVYRVAVDNAGWDAAAFSYRAPVKPHRS